jgi:hypothetical protein
VFLRILIGALVVAGLMVAIKDGRVLRHAGLTGSCSASAAPAGENGYWKACTTGRLSGRPDLSRQGCTSRGLSGKLEYWRCPAALGSSRAS